MAGLAPAEIAAPIRGLLSRQRSAHVLLADVPAVDLAAQELFTRECEPMSYYFLVVATGASTSYFGHDERAAIAPGLKDLDDARVA